MLYQICPPPPPPCCSLASGMDVARNFQKSQTIPGGPPVLWASVLIIPSTLKAMREVNLDIAADYLVMAATLAWIKSRMLLPPDGVEDAVEAPDPDASARRAARLCASPVPRATGPGEAEFAVVHVVDTPDVGPEVVRAVLGAARSEPSRRPTRLLRMLTSTRSPTGSVR